VSEVECVIKIPEKCNFIFNKLSENGFMCFAVGGCVRDSIMGKEPMDWDFTTDAKPQEICSVFSDYKIIDIGKKFGTVCVISDNESYEITTFRSDGNYSDGRHPDDIKFCDSITEDLSRRDFTMNSIAYSVERGIVDPFNGIEDIKNKTIRCTGEPQRRFCEDGLRILRAVRFASVLGFDIEPCTNKGIFECKDMLSNVHPYRMQKELTSLIMGDCASSVLIAYSQILAVLIPEIEPMFNCAQNNPHHKYDVWNHTVKSISYAPQNVLIRLCLLFHDCGKPFVKTTDSKGIDHFKTHQIKSAEIATTVLKRFGYPSSVIRDVSLLVRYHDERFRKLNENIKNVLGVLGKDLFELLLLVAFCDMSAQSKYKREEKLSYHEEVKKEFRRIIETNQCYSLSQLAVSGSDITALGFKNKNVGIVLEKLLAAVIKGEVVNDKDELIKFASRIIL